ncbi:MAG TPA: hypothetical protein VFZ26_04475 [Gemmatimonadales bacterium]
MDLQAIRAYGVSAFVILAACGLASPAPAQRLVRENQLISTTLPSLRIEVAPAFRFVGTVPFRIGSVAEGERFIFVDARDTVVERMVIAQFEAILPASDQRYNYSFQDAQLVAGYRFRTNAFAFSNAAALAEHPEGEAALTAAFLRGRGYVLEDELMAFRYLTVPDSARRHELIIFYVEALPRHGVRLTDLYVNDRETPRWQELAKDLARRARAAFSILPLAAP